MGKQVSAKGITPYAFGATDPTKQTSSNAEAAALLDGDKGVSVPAPTYPQARQAGSKVAGATRTKGGAI